jgi:hypothetical protein
MTMTMQTMTENLRQLFGELFNRLNLANEGKAKGQVGVIADAKAKQFQHSN